MMVYLARQDRELFGCVALLALLGVALICLRPELGILIFITTFFVTYSKFLPATGRFTPNNLLGLLFVALLLLQLYRERDFWFLRERSVQLFLLLIVYTLFSSYIGEQRFPTPAGEIDGTSIKLQKHITRFFFFLFFIHFIRTQYHVKLVLGLLVFFILLTASSAVPTTQGYRLTATLGIGNAGNANWFAFFCVLGMSLLWFYRQVVQWKLLSLLLGITVGGLAVTVLLTASRSGLLNLFLFFILLTMQGRFSIKQQIQTLVVLVLVAYGASSLLTESHRERLGNILPGSSQSLDGHLVDRLTCRRPHGWLENDCRRTIVGRRHRQLSLATPPADWPCGAPAQRVSLDCDRERPPGLVALLDDLCLHVQMLQTDRAREQ